MPDAAVPQRRNTRPKLPKLTPEQRAQVLSLVDQGMSPVDIARQLGLHGSQVNGTIQIHRRLQASSSPSPVPPPGISENSSMPEQNPQAPMPAADPAPVHVAAPAPVAPMRPVSPPTRAVREAGHIGEGRPVQADSGGFVSSFGELRWTVERTQPQDGVLGTHYGPLAIEDIGQIYGSGTYKILKQEPGKVPIEYVKKIGESYGPPRCPRVPVGGTATPGVVQRPGFRPWPLRCSPSSSGVLKRNRANGTRLFRRSGRTSISS